MAFEELTEPRKSYAPKQVYASFDSKSEPAGMTTHRPSASLLKDTPPSVIVALTKLSPIISTLDTSLALITWTSEDNWSSFLLLAIWWLSCLYGDVIFHYAGNWLVLLILGIGFIRRKMRTRAIIRAIRNGGSPMTTGVEDTQKVMDKTLYEIDCFIARCQLLGANFEPFYKLYKWEDPKWSALIVVRLVLITPLYVATLWLFSARAWLLFTGTIFLTCTSSWFKVICTVAWRLKVVRKIVAALVGISYLPGEYNLMNTITGSPRFDAFSLSDPATAETTPDGSRFTTAVSVIENQRRWLGLGWTPSLLPHERSPFTDVDNRTCPAPDNYGLPIPKTTVENGATRTTSWAWIDKEWRIEKDRARDADGWIYFDNSWHNPASSGEYGKYTRRRKWIRNAECTEKVSTGGTGSTMTDVKSEKWRTVSGNGRELISETMHKRPLFRRKSTPTRI